MIEIFKVPCTHPPLTRAIQLCCDARNRILFGDETLRTPPCADNPNFDAEGFAEAIARTTADISAPYLARIAYRAAMPDPSSRKGLKEYVACVLHGLTIGAFTENEGRCLLAGARAATAAYQRGRYQKKQSEIARKPSENTLLDASGSESNAA